MYKWPSHLDVIIWQVEYLKWLQYANACTQPSWQAVSVQLQLSYDSISTSHSIPAIAGVLVLVQPVCTFSPLRPLCRVIKVIQRLSIWRTHIKVSAEIKIPKWTESQGRWIGSAFKWVSRTMVRNSNNEMRKEGFSDFIYSHFVITRHQDLSTIELCQLWWYYSTQLICRYVKDFHFTWNASVSLLC